MKKFSVASRLVAQLIVILGLAVAPMPAAADVFLVNDGGYSADIAPGNGTCADAGGKSTSSNCHWLSLPILCADSQGA